MSGIVGYVGPRQAAPIIMEGLRRLEYRGYDSAGIAQVRFELKVELIVGVDFVDGHLRAFQHFAGHHLIRARARKDETNRNARFAHDRTSCDEQSMIARAMEARRKRIVASRCELIVRCVIEIRAGRH